MSSAPVETLHMQKATAGDDSQRRGAVLRFAHAILAVLYPERARGAAPPDVLLFLVTLGVIAALVGFVMDVSIEQLNDIRNGVLNVTLHAYGSERSAESVAARAYEWFGLSLLCCWGSIWFTGRVAPEAAGSGIPEMK